jgi:hypothetical protein
MTREVFDSINQKIMKSFFKKLQMVEMHLESPI